MDTSSLTALGSLACMGIAIVGYVIYIVYSETRDSKIILFENGLWYKLVDELNNNPKCSRPLYIRMLETITKANVNSSWCFFCYEYFEPSGAINSDHIGNPSGKYSKVDIKTFAKLEQAYQKELKNMVTRKKSMQAKALKQFTEKNKS